MDGGRRRTREEDLDGRKPLDQTVMDGGCEEGGSPAASASRGVASSDV